MALLVGCVVAIAAKSHWFGRAVCVTVPQKVAVVCQKKSIMRIVLFTVEKAPGYTAFGTA